MKVYNLTEEDYSKIFNDIISYIDLSKTYYTKQLEGNLSNGTKYQFAISLFIYKDNYTGKITDIVPIWWEFHTYDDFVYNEFMNDFNFSVFKNKVLEYAENL